jgi:hypothetical protein
MERVKVVSDLFKTPLCVLVVCLCASQSWAGSFHPHCVFEQKPSIAQRGEGTYRFLGMLKVFSAFYYDAPDMRREKPLVGEVPKCLVLSYNMFFKADDFRQVTLEGIKKTTSSDVFEQLQKHIAQFNTYYNDIAPGDTYALSFSKDQGVVLTHNGKPKGSIRNETFASALFAIWLGPVSMDARLTKNLLGGTP